MQTLTLVLVAIVIINFASAKIPLYPQRYDDYDYDTKYSNTMREKYRNYCLKNLEKSYSTWKLFFESVASYCEYAVAKAGAHGAFVRRGPPQRTPDDDCAYLENCVDNLPAL